jgi:hypothetical protein
MTSEKGVDMTRRRLFDGGTASAVSAWWSMPSRIRSPYYSSLGFEPMDLISGALGDRREPLDVFLPIGQIAVAVEQATN